MRTRSPSSSPAATTAGSFGFDPAESTHHFLVKVPASNRGVVEISEHHGWTQELGSSSVKLSGEVEDGQLRVRLPRPKWDAIADAMRVELNGSLRKMAKKPGKWKTGNNLVLRTLGKELMLLAWAIEDADPALIPTAIANWLGLSPEERWWMYTMTAAATGHFMTGRNRGWRKAVRFALTENPAPGVAAERPTVPEFFRLVSETEPLEARAERDEEGPIGEPQAQSAVASEPPTKRVRKRTRKEPA